MKTIFQSKYEQALAFLTINCSFVPDLGLFHGKMGFVLFFAHYAKINNSAIYDDLAGKLMDEISTELHKESSISLESGLCGIGWGIEYLVQNKFMEGNTDEILKDIDNRIMEYNPKRMNDLSFRHGLGGILAYVVARLSSLRESGSKPFDENFLKELKESIYQIDLGEDKELPKALISDFSDLLEGKEARPIQLADLFSSLLKKDITNFSDEMLFINGLEYFWDYINDIKVELTNIIFPDNRKRLYLVSNETRSTRYGIGTYIYQVIESLKGINRQIVIIVLASSKTSTIFVEKQDVALYIYLGDIFDFKTNIDWQQRWKLYAENVLVLLNTIMSQSEDSIFLLNHLHFADFANGFRQYYPTSQIIGVVHYMEWSFKLLGNRSKLKEILNDPDKNNYESLRKGLAESLRFFAACDKIIAIAQHSYNFLLEDCKIPEEKLLLISHGIKNERITESNRILLRQKYGYKSNETLIIFAGRVDAIKGVAILAQAFCNLCQKYENLRLLVAGEGAYYLMQEVLLQLNTKVSFLGFVNKKELYELFYISDIGVIPSLYEDFGYVAIEMMMQGLPIIVGNKSGLEEIVDNGKTGFVVPFKQDQEEIKENSLLLQSYIERLILSPTEAHILGNNGYQRFKNYYDLSHFKERLMMNITNLQI